MKKNAKPKPNILKLKVTYDIHFIDKPPKIAKDWRA